MKSGSFNLKLKIISLIVLAVFSWESFGFAQAGSVPSYSINNSSSFSIPQEIGTVLVQPKEAPLLIHLQDAHANPSAQKNLAKIIEHVSRQLDINLVFVEGAVGELNAKHLQFTQNNELNQKIASRLTALGEFTASDIYLSQHGNKIKFVGMEDAELYRKNIQHLKEVYSQEEKINTWIQQERNALDRKLTRLNNKPLLKTLRTFLQLEEEQTSFFKTISDLEAISKKALELDFTNPKTQIQFPNLIRLINLKHSESNINLEQAKKEFSAIADKLGTWIFDTPSGVSKMRVPKLLTQIEQALFRSPESGVRSSNTNPRFLLEELYEQLEDFNFQNYPNFTKLAKVRIFQHELQAIPLFKEINQWIHQLVAALTETPEEKSAFTEVKQFKLLSKLLLLKLTREEWKGYALGKKVWASVIARQKTSEPWQSLDKTITATLSSALAFYQTAELRDATLLNNVQKTFKETNLKRAIIITGGFHTPAIENHFKASNTPYAVIAPQLEKSSHKDYIKTILDKQISTSEVPDAPHALPATILGNSLGVNIFHRKALISEIIAAEAKSLGKGGEQQRIKEEVVYKALNVLVEASPYFKRLSGLAGFAPVFNGRDQWLARGHHQQRAHALAVQMQKQFSLAVGRDEELRFYSLFYEVGETPFAHYGRSAFAKLAGKEASSIRSANVETIFKEQFGTFDFKQFGNDNWRSFSHEAQYLADRERKKLKREASRLVLMAHEVIDKIEDTLFAAKLGWLDDPSSEFSYIPPVAIAFEKLFGVAIPLDIVSVSDAQLNGIILKIASDYIGRFKDWDGLSSEGLEALKVYREDIVDMYIFPKQKQEYNFKRFHEVIKTIGSFFQKVSTKDQRLHMSEDIRARLLKLTDLDILKIVKKIAEAGPLLTGSLDWKQFLMQPDRTLFVARFEGGHRLVTQLVPIKNKRSNKFSAGIHHVWLTTLYSPERQSVSTWAIKLPISYMDEAIQVHHRLATEVKVALLEEEGEVNYERLLKRESVGYYLRGFREYISLVANPIRIDKLETAAQTVKKQERPAQAIETAAIVLLSYALLRSTNDPTKLLFSTRDKTVDKMLTDKGFLGKGDRRSEVIKRAAEIWHATKHERVSAQSLGAAELPAFLGPGGVQIKPGQEAFFRLGGGPLYVYVNPAKVAVMTDKGELLETVLLDEPALSPRERSAGFKDYRWALTEEALKDVVRAQEFKELDRVVSLKTSMGVQRGRNGEAFFVNLRVGEAFFDLRESQVLEPIKTVLGFPMRNLLRPTSPSENKPSLNDVRRLYVKVGGQETDREGRFKLVSKSGPLRKLMAVTQKVSDVRQLEALGLDPEVYSEQNVYLQEPLLVLFDVIRDSAIARKNSEAEYLIEKFVDRVERMWRTGYVDMDHRPENDGINSRGDLVFHDFDFPMTMKEFNEAPLTVKIGFFVNFIAVNYATFYNIDRYVYELEKAKKRRSAKEEFHPHLAEFFFRRVLKNKIFRDIIEESERDQPHLNFRTKIKEGLYRTQKERALTFAFFEDAVKKRESELAGELQRIKPLRNDAGRLHNQRQIERMKALWREAYLEPFESFSHKQGELLNLLQPILKREETKLRASLFLWNGDQAIFDEYLPLIAEARERVEELREKPQLMELFAAKEIVLKLLKKNMDSLKVTERLGDRNAPQVHLGALAPIFQLRLSSPAIPFHLAVLKDGDNVFVLDVQAIKSKESKTELLLIGRRGSMGGWRTILVQDSAGEIKEQKIVLEGDEPVLFKQKAPVDPAASKRSQLDTVNVKGQDTINLPEDVVKHGQDTIMEGTLVEGMRSAVPQMVTANERVSFDRDKLPGAKKRGSGPMQTVRIRSDSGRTSRPASGTHVRPTGRVAKAKPAKRASGRLRRPPQTGSISRLAVALQTFIRDRTESLTKKVAMMNARKSRWLPLIKQARDKALWLVIWFPMEQEKERGYMELVDRALSLLSQIPADWFKEKDPMMLGAYKGKNPLRIEQPEPLEDFKEEGIHEGYHFADGRWQLFYVKKERSPDGRIKNTLVKPIAEGSVFKFAPIQGKSLGEKAEARSIEPLLAIARQVTNHIVLHSDIILLGKLFDQLIQPKEAIAQESSALFSVEDVWNHLIQRTIKRELIHAERAEKLVVEGKEAVVVPEDWLFYEANAQKLISGLEEGDKVVVLVQPQSDSKDLIPVREFARQKNITIVSAMAQDISSAAIQMRLRGFTQPFSIQHNDKEAMTVPQLKKAKLQFKLNEQELNKTVLSEFGINKKILVQLFRRLNQIQDPELQRLLLSEAGIVPDTNASHWLVGKALLTQLLIDLSTKDQATQLLQSAA